MKRLLILLLIAKVATAQDPWKIKADKIDPIKLLWNYCCQWNDRYCFFT